MPLLSFFAPVDRCKEKIADALETLKPTTSSERSTVAGQTLDGVYVGGRGFGAAMKSLCNYLGSEYGSTFALGCVVPSLASDLDHSSFLVITHGTFHKQLQCLTPRVSEVYNSSQWIHIFVQPHAAEMIKRAIAAFRDQNTCEKPP